MTDRDVPDSLFSDSRPKLSISFSGGRTSAMMTSILLTEHRHTHDVIVTFANTGCEHPKTLDFVHQCDQRMGFGTVWLEAVISPREGEGVRHRVVTYESASRNGEPFRDAIRKYGIPNSTTPQCTARLKTSPMESYLRSRGFRRSPRINYDTAIGIRADEIDRVSSRHGTERFIYPLVSMGIRKEDVVSFWKAQPFDLELPGAHYGNCVTCWKKSDRKLKTIALERPELFAFAREMETTLGHVKAEAAAGHNGRRFWFRGHRSVDDIFRESRLPFVPYQDADSERFAEDLESACGESCEVGADE